MAITALEIAITGLATTRCGCGVKRPITIAKWGPTASEALIHGKELHASIGLCKDSAASPTASGCLAAAMVSPVGKEGSKTQPT